MKIPLTTNRIIVAVAVGLAADLLQFPLNAASAIPVLSGFVFMILLAVDVVTVAVSVSLLGFHWALLPSLAAEFFPRLGRIPTWTACIAYVIYCRKKEEGKYPLPHPVIDIEADHIRNASAPSALLAPLMAARPTPATLPVETRLGQLAELRQRALITEEEYTTKRGQILAEL